MDKSQDMSHQAGQVMGQAKEKASNMMDKYNQNQSLYENKGDEKQAGQQMQAKAQGAADAAKNAAGANK
ncbi:uncharacterized protein HKW66_Vig0108400 [Vigna angularis]|uniref:Uncharacterized protein n=1 Tax=Phaseolus angularis TaxID=3914 RepID=A0A8T0KX30_PHAAN|nr:uncharacterized protein HKW66_Vig0108400 [Vigna angularis]